MARGSESFFAEMNNINIISDELKQNEIDIDKQTLRFHTIAILDQHRDLYRAVNANGLYLDKVYREINITNFGRIFAYLALVCLQSDSEKMPEELSMPFEHFISQRRIKRNNKLPILITLSLTLIALYVSPRVRTVFAISCLIKMFATEFVLVLTDIYNSSMQQGIFPQQLKRAVVIPIPKVSPPSSLRTI